MIIALSRDYADFMSDYLSVPRAKIEVMRPGLNLEGFPVGPYCREGPVDPPAGENVSPMSEVASNSPFRQKGPPKTIGFLSRICPEKGLHLLVDALHSIEQMPGAPPFRLRVAGYLDRADRRYLHDVYKQAAADGLADRFEYVGELDHSGKIAFLKTLDVFCLPSLLRESKGLPVLEAWACGVPAVLPDYGAFSHLVADTGGGLLYDPQKAGGLESALGRMLTDTGLAAECGLQGRQAIHERYNSEQETREILALYAKLVQRQEATS